MLRYASFIGWRLLEQSKASKASNSTASSNVTALEQQLRDSEAKAVVAQELEVPSSAGSADSDACGKWELDQCESVRRMRRSTCVI